MRPLCLWMDGSSKVKGDDPYEGTTDGAYSSCKRPPAGFSMMLSELSGLVMNGYAVAQLLANPALVCDHPARLNIIERSMSEYF